MLTGIPEVEVRRIGGVALAVAAAACGGRTRAEVDASVPPRATLEVCENGASDARKACAWVAADLDGARAHRREGEVIPYRLRLEKLAVGARHALVVEWRALDDGKHAIDALGRFDASETSADACAGVPSCRAELASTSAGFTLWNGTLVEVSPIAAGAEAGAERVTVSFTPAAADAVLAWGGRVASHRDWGLGAALVDLPGAAYRMRAVDLDGAALAQERALSIDAIVPHLHVMVVKRVINDDGAGSAVAGDFTLQVTAATRATPASFPGSEAGTFVEVEGPTLTPWFVHETGPSGYAGQNECFGKILDQPQTRLVRCTITNDDLAR